MPTCLIVDDSRIIRRVGRRILQSLDFAPEEAASGEEALALCSQSVPDVILLDWNMPGMDGLAVLKALKARKTRQPRVIFCTNNTDLSQIREALDAGADDYIMKPFDRDILHSKFQQAGLC